LISQQIRCNFAQLLEVFPKWVLTSDKNTLCWFIFHSVHSGNLEQTKRTKKARSFDMTLWLVIVGGLLTIYSILSLSIRPSVAIATILPIALLVPVWCGIDVGMDFLNVKTAVAIGMLLLYSLFPRATFPWRLVPCDYAVLAMVLVNLASDSWNSEPQWSIPLLAYAEWIVPYLAGRLAFQNREDMMWAWPSLAIVSMLLGAVSLFEAMSGLNPYEWVFGLRPFDGTIRNALRWNIRRAYATCQHPLYHGVLLCWLFTWLAFPAWRALNRQAGSIWLLPPLFGVFSPLATGSRGPFLGNFLILGIILFFAKRQWRKAMVVTTLAIFLLAFFNQDRIFDMLDDWSGEFDRGRQSQSVVIGEREEKVSSARARLTLFSIYKEPLLKAGLLGYGTAATTGFPVNVPIGSDEAEAARSIWSLDNAYLLMVLRFGYLGLIAFFAIIGVTVWQLIAVHDADPRRSQAVFAASLGAGTLAIAILVFGVWMPADFGFAWLWGVGASSGLYYQIRPTLELRRKLDR
jgi:O-Antigen ligase